MNKKQKNLLIRIIIATVFFIPLYLISEDIIHVDMPKWALILLFLVPYLTVGYDIIRKAFLGIKNGKVFDECFLMTVSTIGAIALGEYGEGVAVMLLYQVGELFQSYAVGKSRKNISELMDIRPDYANIGKADGTLERVDPDEVEVGSVIIIQPEAFGGNMIRLTEILETDSPLIRFASDRGSCPYEQKFFAAELYEHFACKDPASEIIR